MKAIIVFSILVSLIPCGFSKCYRHGLECPDYQVVENHTNYELRSYPAIKWAVTETTSSSVLYALVKLFMKLSEYFTRNNAEGIIIPSTYPSRKIWSYTRDGYRVKVFHMLPSQVSNNPPVPLDPSVRILSEPPQNYFVRKFSGLVFFDYQWDDEAEILKSDLTHRPDVDTWNYYRCTYDNYQLNNRLNEIWIKQK